MRETRSTPTPKGLPAQRQAATGNRIVGYAAVFDSPAPIGPIDERIARGAFADCIGRDNVVCLANHDPAWVLGRTGAGTLRLREDAYGLRFECDLDPENPQHAAVRSNLARGDVSGCSFSFDVAADGEAWSYPPGKRPVRTVVRVARLFDVGPVVFPAYSSTSVALREQFNVHNIHPTVLASRLRLMTTVQGFTR